MYVTKHVDLVLFYPCRSPANMKWVQKVFQSPLAKFVAFVKKVSIGGP